MINLLIKLTKKKGKPMKKGKKKAERISRKKAMELMLGNKGYFFTAVYTKKDGEERTINCQCLKGQKSSLGYVKVREASKMRTDPANAIRNINLQTIKELKIAGKRYRVG